MTFQAWIKLHEVAEMFGVKPQQIRNWINSNHRSFRPFFPIPYSYSRQDVVWKRHNIERFKVESMINKDLLLTRDMLRKKSDAEQKERSAQIAKTDLTAELDKHRNSPIRVRSRFDENS